MEPCAPWPIDPGCTYGIPVDPATRTDAQVIAMALATEILWRRTMGLYGTCPITVRPCGRKCGDGFTYFPAQLPDGRWINITCPCDDSPCGCCHLCELYLDGPVASVTTVKIDGVTLTSSAYRIDDGYKLVRTDGGTCWPSCQNLGAPDTDTNTFSVTYERGLPVPAGGKRAVAALAAEIIKSCAGGPCRLPARVQEITRQGVTMQMINDPEFLQSGLTGLPEVDMWLTAINPTGVASASSVWSPDLEPTLRTTTWP